MMQLKIFEVNSDAVSAIEDEVNGWLADKEFKSLSIQNIVEYAKPRVGVRIYIFYELAASEAYAEEE